MKLIKKMDIYILKGFLQLFAGTFFVCLFIFMMQFLWKYINDLVGKGLGIDVLAKFFFYACLTLVPMSLPLAVLLASLISFGNMGEKLELLSMKAAGIPLLRILLPIFFVSGGICVGSFYFQNKIQPEATRQLATLLWSMRQKSPELEIPEGIFYSGIPGYNLYVEHKDRETGMLYGVMIYSTVGGYDHMEIVLADSARLQGTKDKQHLKLTLYDGERFRNMDPQQGNMLQANVPYMRETFFREIDLIPFDASFQMMDANLFNSDAQTKELKQIITGIDSIHTVIDSLGHEYYITTMNQYLHGQLPVGAKDSALLAAEAMNEEPFDTIWQRQTPDQMKNALRNAVSCAQSAQAEFEFRAMTTESTNQSLRKHRIEARKKFTLALSCMIFFFIGAPLGAIIRKGGLGVPVVTSVLIFIFYYIINAGGEKMAKTGEWQVPFGVWLSTMILLPIGLFLIHKANKDSVVFNIEGYRNFFMRLLGLRMSRRINRKEVIITEPTEEETISLLQSLSDKCREYMQRHHLWKMPSYINIFFHYKEDVTIIQLSEQLESTVETLHNSRSNFTIAMLNELPILVPDAHTRPTHNAKVNMAIGIFLPLGLFFFLRIWRFRLRLMRDLNKIVQVSEAINEKLRVKNEE